MSRETAFVDETRSPLRFVLAARHATVAALIDGVMQGEAFLALTGPPGVGKTTVASAIHDELARRSARVLQVRRGNGDGISIRTIAAQILGEPEAELDDHDIERLFDVMTAREAPDQRFALIIDDAECLQADALGYMRLLAILAKDTMPQVVFVGDSAFWDTEYAARSDLKEMITARWDLAGLSPDEAHGFIEQSVASSGSAAQAVFAPGGPEALVRQGGGSYGRIVSLLSLATALRVEQHDHWLTPTLIDEAAAKLDAGVTGPLEATGGHPTEDGDDANPGRSGPAPEPTPEPDAADVTVAPPVVAGPSRWVRRVARAAGVMIVLFVLATVAGWQVLVHITRTDARTADVDQAGTANAPGRSVTEAATRPVRLPDLRPLAISQAISVEAESPKRPVAIVFADQPTTPAVTNNDTPTVPAIASPEPPTPAVEPHPPMAAAQAQPVGAMTDMPTALATPLPVPPAATATPQTATPDAARAVTVTDPPTAPAVTPPEPSAPAAEPQTQQAATPTVTSNDTPTAQATTPPEAPAPAAEPQTQQAATPTVTSNDTPTAQATTPPEAPAPAAEPQAQQAATPTVTSNDTPTTPAITPPEAPAPAPEPQTQQAATPVVTSTDTPTAPAITPPEAPTPPAEPQTQQAATPVVTSTDTPTAPAITPPEAPTPAAEPQTQQAATPVVTSTDTPTAPGILPEPASSTHQPQTREAAPPVAAIVAPKTSDAATPAPTLTGAVSSPAVEPRAEPPKGAPVSPRFSSADLTLLLSRGDTMLALGDISAARRLYERAAALGSARAATAVGKTYDPVFLASIHATGIIADRDAAAGWYRKGAALGDRDGADRLARLAAAQ